jgi:uncharacterized protein YgiM (DUF1202 family)
MTRTKKALLVAAAMIFIALTAPGDARANEVCTVADPSGTPLNVRSQPKLDGSILGALNNDTAVVVKERRGQWASIVPESAGKSGWVWAEYLSCGKKVPPPEWELDCRHGWMEYSIGGEGAVNTGFIDVINGEDETKIRIEAEELPKLKKAVRDLEACIEKYWACWAWHNRRVLKSKVARPRHC